MDVDFAKLTARLLPLKWLPEPKSSQTPSLASGKAAPTPLRFHLSRHDPHNLELITRLDVAEGLTDTEMEVAIFFPKNFQLPTWTPNELAQDFTSRFRLAFPRHTEVGLDPLEAAIASLRALPPELDQDLYLQKVRHTGAVLGETLRAFRERAKKELILLLRRGNSITDQTEAFFHLATRMERVAGVMTLLRAIPTSSQTTLDLLLQYARIEYQSLLASLRKEIDVMLGAPFVEGAATELPVGLTHLIGVLDQLQASEAKAQVGYVCESSLTETERELRLLQGSQLKKFFQSDMFVEVTRKKMIQRISEPLAAAAAGFAALWAAIFQRMASPAWIDVGFQGLFVLCLGIALYVLKDRAKDHLRAFFTRRVSTYLPDLDQELLAEGRPIGRIREWLKTKPLSELPDGLHSARLKACISGAEKHLPEDVLYYRRSIKISGRETPGANIGAQMAASSVALQQVLRINVDRYLKYLDDPYKTISFLNAEGRFENLNSHRVYPLHVVIRSRFKENAPIVYRVLLDKNGIDRVEPLRKDR